MKRNRFVIFCAVILTVTAGTLVSREREFFGTLASTVLIGRQPGGFHLVATNQLVKPWQQQWIVKGRPVEIAFDSKKQLLAVMNMRSIHLLDGATGIELGKTVSRPTSYTGLAFRPGARELWASEATRSGPDSILIATFSEKAAVTRTDRVNLPGHPVPTGIAFSEDGSTAYVALSNNNSVAVVDARTRKVKREILVGVVPYGVALSPRTQQLFVSNRGGRRPRVGEPKAWSSASQVVTDTVTGATATGTVSVIDLATMEVREVPVGLAPAGLALSPDESILAVSNAHSDSVTFIDTKTFRSTETPLPAFPKGSLGVTPSAAVFAPDGRTLYVSCGGTDSIAVLQGEGVIWQSKGALPAGWYPTALAIDNDGALRVANVKGVGSTLREKGNHNSREFEGSIWKIPGPTAAQIQAGTREVAAANAPRFEPNGGGVADLSKLGIQHVFLIIKENRTYDQVYGDMPRGNNDKNLVMYGRDVTPNHHALAEQFVQLDNFYTGGAISFDGHQWLMQGFVSDYVERGLTSAPRGYAWNMSDALTVSPFGFFWQDARRPLDVRLYGPFSEHIRWDPATHEAIDINESELLPWGDYWRYYKQGKWRDQVGNRSGVPALQKYVSAHYPASTMNIPDQIRAEAWLEELAEREKSGNMPNLLIFTMTSDHTMGTRPGFPTPRAMVADNDLALGRIVEGISKSRFWQNSLILVTEDDAQDGVDHVDGRRTIGLAIGPHIRRGLLDSNHYNHSSMIRTIQDIFRVRPRVRYAATARAMNSVFTPDVNTKPYKALQPAVSLTEMNPPATALSGRQLWAAKQSMKLNSHEVDDFPAELMNQILWGDAKGYSTPYPGHRSH